MKFRGRKILITGGSSGIGLEMSKRFIEKGNTVIVCSRSVEKLKAAQSCVSGIITYQCDISDEAQCRQLAGWIKEEHPGLSILINNAAIVNKTDFPGDETIMKKCAEEFSTNFLAPVRLIKLLYPVLEQHKEPVIINITTGLVYTPRTAYPFYNSTKAALHSFTQVLRHQLKNTSFKVTEVLFPVVDTPWHQGNTPRMAITPEKAVNEMIQLLEKGQQEIKVGAVKLLYFISRLAPGLAFKKINSLK
mgnify:CR=1 FL=1